MLEKFNKKLIIILGFIICSIAILFYSMKYLSIENNKIVNQIRISNVDITEPRFSINSSSQKILVTAKEGNFIEENKILLKKNVKFSSNDFSIESDNVTFDRVKQTAFSEQKSVFKSKKTTISSEGFNIYDNGNKIKFFGNSVIILKWKYLYLSC